ncbi:cytochrome c oxidase subunit 3 [Acetobacter fallax]|uniref:Cytochrome C oxidase subunit III n=1 Tax=Acetobacter fallax TaxID=1737473 RepID=A0ABX0KBU3_9PROT|nr:cytochrome c oxidase subunit 3 [Acetobacter fallax]NHO33909.1 cytochrome C oxidase subunit III [Acetobacter fallax]NHO37452.1 cytochrome C oxidase subunit III [Acetobacter fallax]
MSDAADPHGPYETLRHQEETTIAGMWLFLASESLLFGGLFLVSLIYAHTRANGWAAGVRHTDLVIGGVNTVILITSSAIYTLAVEAARQDHKRRAVQAAMTAAALGLVFLLLKAFEWSKEFKEHLFPGTHFAITGADAGGAQLFYSFYFLATFLHAVHMIVGTGLIAWICLRAGKVNPGKSWNTSVEIVGLYWSFVDLVWMILFPVLYLVGRT